MKLYDVIIIGGGPAGLSIGSEISKKFNVLVVEKYNVGKTNRSWFVPQDIAEKNSDVSQFFYGGVKKFIVDTFSGAALAWDSKLFASYPYVMASEILLHWAEKIKENASTIIEDCVYIEHRSEKDKVIVKTSKGDFEGRLLLDASGHDSDVLKNCEIDHEYYWWSVYGGTVKHNEKIPKENIGDFMLWQTFEDTNIDKNSSLRRGRPVLEYEILSEDTSFVLILYLRKEKVSKHVMKEMFEKIFASYGNLPLFKDAELIDCKFGWYPSGDLPPRISKNRITFAGDSGGWPTPCGWGMGAILDHYKEYSDNLSKLLYKDKLDARSLNHIFHFSIDQKHQVFFDKLMIRFISNATAEQLDKFIDFFKLIDPLVCEKMFTLSISNDEIIDVLKLFFKQYTIRELIKILSEEDMFAVLEETFYLSIKGRAKPKKPK